MDNAVALQPNLTPAAPAVPTVDAPTGFGARVAALPAKSKIGAGIGIAALLAIIVALSLWSSRPDYKVLYANLSDKDGGAIIAQLSQMNVPYQHAEGGGAILVPGDKVHDLRLKLASQGLPKGSTVGFELMDNAKFGITQFQERLTFQRGLEGELTRSIGAMSAVQSARVHLALPNQNGFFREQQKPSASVLLSLYPGRTLDRAQLAGIVHLVSSSVPELAPKAVSVIDQNGTLLTENPDGSSANSLDAKQLQYVNQIESSYTRRIMDLLEPVVGRDNLRAQVTAEIDFSQSESTSEQFRPNQGNEPAAVRSQQTSESTQPGAPVPTGVPGAATNQPPVPATAPINGTAQQLQAAGNVAPGSNGGAKRDAITNYEVDKTVRVTRNATGSIKRINAAVVINHRSSTNANGKTTTVPLSEEELQKLTTLVQETVGYSAERGDSVKVVNAPFQTEKVDTNELPLWKDPQTLELLRGAAVPAALTLLALIIVFGVIRPALKAATPPEPARPALDAVVADTEVLPALEAAPALNAPLASERLDSARQLARDNPAAVANIVRNWVSKETAS
ncbi:flagellar basal-body MS-ring/collar protein FliF [Aquabacterium sp. A7-Y]|uniref:flagellar basal-body MS-ring/collar protein FliF n=1 Tax=Aquabacterium sp. A7-Y TaxID=1349605 RepID=UPI00223CF059|nr:flagellar basal-body MS-ring/collar protein FliF [Aquabacterium sp. A7-Y]MCW7540550.1 flagellar basal-body MS-ring/collar protein FliF [Aquabacterium sp. A7-Y]